MTLLMDPFDTLDVRGESTDSEVRTAFRLKSLLTHPDKRPPSEKEKAEREFAELVSCYEKIAKREDRVREWRSRRAQTEHASAKSQSFQESPSAYHHECKDIEVDLEQVYEGTQMPVEMTTIRGENGIATKCQSCAYVDIPKGTDSGEILETSHIVFGKKERVDVRISVRKHARFIRKGLDLHYEHSITLKEALCGFSAQIEHLSGRKINLNCSGRVITPSTVQRIQGMGFQRGDKVGVLVISFNILFPTSITEEARQLIDALF